MCYRGVACNQTSKKKELIFEKYGRRRKEGVDILEVQTVKKEGVDM